MKVWFADELGWNEISSVLADGCGGYRKCRSVYFGDYYME